VITCYGGESSLFILVYHLTLL